MIAVDGTIFNQYIPTLYIYIKDDEYNNSES
jgi:hypothetical protein